MLCAAAGGNRNVIFTGNVLTDFGAPGLNVFTIVDNIDFVSVNTGWNARDLRFVYNNETDVLFVGACHRLRRGCPLHVTRMRLRNATGSAAVRAGVNTASCFTGDADCNGLDTGSTVNINGVNQTVRDRAFFGADEYFALAFDFGFNNSLSIDTDAQSPGETALAPQAVAGVLRSDCAAAAVALVTCRVLLAVSLGCRHAGKSQLPDEDVPKCAVQRHCPVPRPGVWRCADAPKRNGLQRLEWPYVDAAAPRVHHRAIQRDSRGAGAVPAGDSRPPTGELHIVGCREPWPSLTRWRFCQDELSTFDRADPCISVFGGMGSPSDSTEIGEETIAEGSNCLTPSRTSTCKCTP
jgi:hypothetical protein